MAPLRSQQALLFVWLICVVAATWAPYNFGVPAAQEQGLEVVLSSRYPQDPADFVLNLLLFMPLGAVLHHQGQRRSRRLVFIVIPAAAAGLLISLTIEYLQVFLPSRDPSLNDVVSNTAGALTGALAHRAWGDRLEARVARLRASRSPALLVCLMVGFTVLALLISGALQLRTRLSNWSVDYPLLIGNEQTGDRPWRGRIFALELTDAGTPSALVRRFSADGSLIIPGTWIAAFDFSGTPPYRDAAGNLPSLDWTEHRNESSPSGIRLPGRPWLQTEGPAAGMTRRLGVSNAFTLRVLCATDDVHQEGPARIVSNSWDTGLRNFTLGQQGADMVFRLRTLKTGLNGDRPEVVIPGVFSNEHPREILVTYDGATLLATVAGSERVSRTELTPGSVLALALISPDIKADELQMLKMVYLMFLFLVPGALVGLLGHTRRGQLVFGVLWVPAFALLLEGTLVLASGRPFDWRNVAVTAFVGTVVLTVVAMTFSGTGPRQPGSLDVQTEQI